MVTSQIISGSIFGLISILLGIYVYFASKGKGPILSNSYIFASDKEKKKLDIKKEYKLVTIVFSSLTGIFTLLTLFIFTEIKLFLYLMWVLIIFVCIYAVIDAIKSEEKKY